MKNLLLRIYDYFAVHRRALWIGFAVVFAALVALAATLRYNEDIMDFLPITEEERAALDAYQSQDAAAQLVLIIDGGEEDRRYDALDEIEVLLSVQGYQLSLEMDPTEQIAELYAQLPCLIADSVYDRFDSLFTPEAVRAALLRDRTILNTPGSSFLAPAIQNDPLGLVQLPSFQTSLASSKNYAFLEWRNGDAEECRLGGFVAGCNGSNSRIFPGTEYTLDRSTCYCRRQCATDQDRYAPLYISLGCLDHPAAGLCFPAQKRHMAYPALCLGRMGYRHGGAAYDHSCG